MKKPCGKQRYKTQHDARRAALRMGHVIGELYHCAPCGAWHLSRYNPKVGRRRQW